MSLRSRTITHLDVMGVNQQLLNGVVILNLPYQSFSRGFQTTSSNGHRVSLLGKSDCDIGGSFVTQLADVDSGGRWIDITTKVNQAGDAKRHAGPVFAWSNQDTRSAVNFETASSNSQLNAYGATGIARALPTNPLSGMGQFLGELRDLPKIPDIRNWQTRARNFKNLGRRANHASNAAQAASEYLNVQFGWVPFINDLRSAIDVTRHASKHVRQYARDSGRTVRRGSTVFSDSSTTTSLVTNSWGGAPAFDNTHIASLGKLYKTVTTSTHIYFRGAFTYYLPTDEGPLGKLLYYEALANKLYGLRLTPDLLWKLAPWSWAADWIGNIGDNVRNWSAFQNDGLVMRYGYLMEEKSVITSYAGTGLILKNGENVSLTQTYRSSTKSRIQATPYGFGLNPSSFSAKQWSIIAALGISRGPRLLNKVG